MNGDTKEERKPLTTSEAKSVIKAELQKRSLHFTKLTARTVSFSGFGYGSCIFVKIHGWKPDPVWADLKAIAKEQGFCIESADGIST